MAEPKYIRNFAIVAHIDHGKSTLADRLLEMTNTVESRKMKDQILDSNPIERERGITIKLAPVRMKYNYLGSEYILNLIDTPGHVDFSYEVSRSLAACEGVILLVDASTGIQAQTMAHYSQIKKHNLVIIPVINKIDLITADTDAVKKQLTDNFHFAEKEIISISAKNSTNIDQVFKTIIEKIPPPSVSDGELRALVFTSYYDPHMGVVVYIRIKDGIIPEDEKKKEKLQFYASKAQFHPLEIGIFTPEKKSINVLRSGEVGYLATGLKDLKLAQSGDTILRTDENVTPLPGFKKPTPFVFTSIYPTDNDDYLNLRKSLEKLQLTDSSISISPVNSQMLGKGFLCGFLGLLHTEISIERLNREFHLNTVATIPTVEYKIKLRNGNLINVRTVDDYPDPSVIAEISEPIMKVIIYTPSEWVGNIMQLAEEKRGKYIDLKYFGLQGQLEYLVPLSEMIIDFFDRLKSLSKGYASMDYEYYEHKYVEAIRLDILLNHKKVDAFSQIIVKVSAEKEGNRLVKRLKELIPRHQFQVAIQAAIGSKIIARSDISAFKKDVTAKLYGGDRTRKDKLLESQRKGKKRMKLFGRVEIPQEVFTKLHKTL